MVNGEVVSDYGCCCGCEVEELVYATKAESLLGRHHQSSCISDWDRAHLQ